MTARGFQGALRFPCSVACRTASQDLPAACGCFQRLIDHTVSYVVRICGHAICLDMDMLPDYSEGSQ